MWNLLVFNINTYWYFVIVYLPINYVKISLNEIKLFIYLLFTLKLQLKINTIKKKKS